MPTETVSWQVPVSFDFLRPPGNCEILSIAGNINFSLRLVATVAF